MTHTPGPWARSKYVLNFGRVITREAHLDRPCGASVKREQCRDKYMQTIASVSQHPCHLSGGVAEAEANERLIAAAPELYEALLHMKTCGACAEDNWNACEGGRRAEAALAKAEGRS